MYIDKRNALCVFIFICLSVDVQPNLSLARNLKICTKEWTNKKGG